MTHPLIMSANGKVRYDGLLQAAEMHRRVKRLKRSDIGLPARILSSLGNALAIIGHKVQAATQAKTPLWNE